MFYFEKDYIMRLIHGIARILANMLFGREMEEEGGVAELLDETAAETNDYFRRLVDSGQINTAENRLFEIIETTAWERKQTAALVLLFYDYVNGKEDDFLLNAGFSRDEVIRGLEDAMSQLDLEIPEYLKLS